MKIKMIVCLLGILTTHAFGQTPQNDLSSLAQIQQGVTSKRVSSYDKSGGNDDFLKIADGEKKVIFDESGAGIINHIWITMAPHPGAMNRNDIIIRMYWDGKEYPSVVSPIGPFFGQGWNEAYEFNALPISASPDHGKGLVSYFNMPFSKGARIEIENQSGRAIDAFYFYVDYVSMDKLPAGMGRFHSWYNKQLMGASKEEGENEWAILGKYGNNTTGKDNYVFADIKGKGHFVGVNYYVHSPSPMWYGEGDDMIYIDGAEKPTLHGTGTEDYFNTAFCPKNVFSHPYYGYARVNNDMGWLGRTHLYRFHVTDPLFFNKSLKFTIEHGHNNVLTLDLASVAYWYQNEASPVPPIPDKESRRPKPFIGIGDFHKWRNEWRKSKGNDPQLWGN
ncbi:glycoside hydrolase family 172 protein [Chitinophaga niabensis]|uniref:glycoside hydrolase family 172 protein n=1 Tax=Chitinophaga niabensis TaxID=536979 RepID=UPI0031BB5E6B